MPWRASSRRYSGLPRVSSHIALTVRPSTGPPNPAASSAAASSRDSAAGSTTAHRSSFHKVRNASGAGASPRTVTTAKVSPAATSWCTSAADASSRRCPSSTHSTSRSPAARAASAWRARARRSAPSGGPVPVAGSSGANAPNGIDAAERVARTHATALPRPAATSEASSASRVLPTPAGPAITTPPAEPSASASATTRSSASRPTSGHRMRRV